MSWAAPTTEETKRSVRPRGFSRARLRLKHVETLISDRHQGEVPLSDSGSDLLLTAAECCGRIAVDAGNPLRTYPLLRKWCATWAPGFQPSQVHRAAEKAVKLAGWMPYDQHVGDRLGLSEDDRFRLGLNTIESTGIDPQIKQDRRLAARQKRERLRLEQKRRAKGVIPRKQYLENSLSQTKPWLALGISRRTYERLRAARANRVP